MDRLWLTGSGSGVAIMTDSVLRDRLLSFIESEGRSCSFDPGLITPEYVYRMWGGGVSLEEIEKVMVDVGRMVKENESKEYNLRRELG